MRWPQGAMRSRNFRLLLACDVTNGIGSAVAFVAIPFAVLAISGTAADVGWVATAGLIPMIAFLLLGGVAGDRFARHKVMMAANAAQGTAQAVAAILMLTGTAKVWELIVLAAVRGIGLGFYYPASQGLLPQTVPDNDRAQANALARTGRNTAGIAGASLGGVLVGLAGPGWGLAVDAISFAIATAMRAGMRFPALPAARRESTLHQLRVGWREFLARRWLWVIVLTFTLMTAVTSGTINVLGPVVADARLGGAKSWGLILASYGIGAVLGGLVMMRYRPQRMLLVAMTAAGVFAILLFALAVPLAVPLIMAAGLLVGLGSEVFMVNWVTTMQQEIPHDLMSRLSSFDAFGSFALAPVGVAIAGPLATSFGTPTVLAVGGFVILGLSLSVLLVPEIRHLRRRSMPVGRTEPAMTQAASEVAGAGT
ncbi:MAG: MFS transporter [Streptosporangiaceae bacterium]